MGFKKGAPRLPNAGRKKGAPNKRTVEIQEMIKAKIGMTLPEALMEYAAEHPRERKEIYVELLPYVCPKLSSVQMDANVTTIDKNKVQELAEKMEELERDSNDMEVTQRSGAI